MSSSPVCTCCVCPAHGPAGHGADQPGGGAGWAGPARRYLESVVEWLDGPEAMGAGHGELEARLQVHSREQYRLLLQGHLDERARLETRRSAVTGSDGVSRPRVENGHRRGLTTVFGPVTVTRKAYRAVPGTAAADAGTACCRPPRTACPGRLGRAARADGTAPEPMPDGTGTTTAPRRPAAAPRSTGVGTADAESVSGRCGAEPAGGQALGGTGAVGGGGGGARVVRRCPGGDRAGDRGAAGQAAGGGPGPHGRGGHRGVLRRPPAPAVPGPGAGPAGRRQGHRDAPGQPAPRHRRARRPGVGEAGHPALTRGETRPQADGRDRRGVRPGPRPAHGRRHHPHPPPQITAGQAGPPAGPGRDRQMAGRQRHRRHPRRHRGHVRRGRTPRPGPRADLGRAGRRQPPADRHDPRPGQPPAASPSPS